MTLNFCVRYERHTFSDISTFGSEHRDLRHPFHVEWFLSDISTFGSEHIDLRHLSWDRDDNYLVRFLAISDLPLTESSLKNFWFQKTPLGGV